MTMAENEQNEMQTQKGRKLLDDGGFMFTFHKHNSTVDVKFWRCVNRNDGCKGRLHTDLNDVILRRVGYHTHGSNAVGVQVAKVKTAMKRRAHETMEQPSQIITSVIQNIDQATMGQLPTRDAARKTIQRVRRQNAIFPPTPNSLAELVIPDRYTKYEANEGQEELFLLGDTGPDDQNRILLFGRDSYRAWSNEMDEVFMDGTFTLSPPLFEQVYVILSKRGQYVFPVLYALLPNKLQRTYYTLFILIIEIWPQFNPSHIYLDYEMAVLNSARELFPNTEFHGCLFHLMKNFRRQLTESGLLQRYNTDSTFAHEARMIPALAFVPITDLNDAFDSLSDALPEYLLPILTWLEDNYIGRPVGRNRRRRPALFPPQLWNVYDRVMTDQDRTNNHSEAAHRRLQTELDVHHPSIWRFIDGLRRIQKGRDMVYEQYVAGAPAPEKRKKYKQADDRIYNLVNSYADRDIVEYLRGIAHNFLME